MNVIVPCTANVSKTSQPPGFSTISGLSLQFPTGLPGMASQSQLLPSLLALVAALAAWGLFDQFPKTRSTHNFCVSFFGLGAGAWLDPHAGSGQQSKEGSGS